MVGLGPGFDFDPVLQRAVVAHRGRAIAFRVTRPAELSRDLVQINLLTHPYGTRDSIDTGRTAENGSPEALINDPAVFNVEVREEAADANGKNDESRERDAEYWIAGDQPLAWRALFALRDL